MPSFVMLEKCDGCKGQDKTACMYICPVDLMTLNKDDMKAYNQDPSLCWECYNCVKICPPAGHRRPRLRRLHSPGLQCCASARFRFHHVDGQIPQRFHQKVQVPHPHHR